MSRKVGCHRCRGLICFQVGTKENDACKYGPICGIGSIFELVGQTLDCLLAHFLRSGRHIHLVERAKKVRMRLNDDVKMEVNF